MQVTSTAFLKSPAHFQLPFSINFTSEVSHDAMLANVTEELVGRPSTLQEPGRSLYSVPEQLFKQII